MGGRGVSGGAGVVCKGFASHIMERDYPKHKGDWGGAITKEQYAEKAKRLMAAPVGGEIEGFVDENGIIYRYHDGRNEFGMMSDKGYIINFFKPAPKRAYWREQARLNNPNYEEDFYENN